MAITQPATTTGVTNRFHPRSNAVWIGLGLVNFLVAMALAYPTALTAGAIIPSILPWVVLLAMAAALGTEGMPARLAGLGLAVAAWTALLVHDDRWTLLAIAIYMLCFTVDPARTTTGTIASGVVSAAWFAAIVVGDSPAWTTFLPLSVFATGTALSLAMHRTARMAEEQAELVRSLRATRADLAEAQRARGVLEERARMASEIHDSLAQGFTSIVLLARAASRSSGGDHNTDVMATGLADIEEAARGSLAEARRIVAASSPPELLGDSLHDVLARLVRIHDSPRLRTRFQLTGEPRRVSGEAEATLLRVAQEALRNTAQHAAAARVEVTLSWLEDSVVLDVRDDGSGFVPGAVRDRGSLTGGQGLTTLARRVAALGGTVLVESDPGAGTTVSTRLPAGAP